MFEKCDPLLDHNHIYHGLPVGAHKLSALFDIFDESREAFCRVLCHHNMYSFLLKFNIFNSPIGPEDMVQHLQGCDLSEPFQMILYGGEEVRLTGLNDLFLDYAVSGIVSSEQSLVLFELICCNYTFFCYFKGGRIFLGYGGG